MLLSSPQARTDGRHTALRDAALRALREAIYLGRLRPGQRILDVELAQQIGVSKTPVREAVQELSREGLIVSRPYRGAFVVEVTPQLIREVLGMRIVLEQYAAQLAMPRVTDADVATLRAELDRLVVAVEHGDALAAADHDMAFHELLYHRAQNAVLFELWSAIRSRVQLIHVLFRAKTAATPQRIRQRHDAIIAAIQSGDAARVQHEVIQHISYAQDDLLEAAGTRAAGDR